MNAGSDSLFLGSLLLTLLAALPVVVTWVARRYALEPGRRPAEAWFGFKLLTSWLMIAQWMAWPIVIFELPVFRAFAILAAPLGRAGMSAVLFAAALLPLLIPSIAIMIISRDLTRRLRSEDWSEAESREQVSLQVAALVIAAIGLGIAATLGTSGLVRPAILIATLAIVALSACLARYRRLAGIELHAVTWGELRSRLFTMAEAVKVPLKQLHIMPMARSRIANAFALNDQSVILTDYLIDRLSRRELEAVMAHEIAHLRLRHPWKLALAMLAVIVPAVLLFFFVPGGYRYVGLIVLAALLVRMVVSRRFEYQADAEAVRICGDPEALISGLAALGAANAMPMHWGRGIELLMTHPSTLRRIERIAAQAAIPADRLAALLAREGLGDAPYEQPPSLLHGGKAFSSTYKRRVIQRLSLTRLMVAAGVPALLIAISGFLTPRPILMWAAGALAFATLLLFHERGAMAMIAALEARVRSRVSTGAPESDRLFVAISPGAETRVYEGFLDWDLGLLSIGSDRIEYAGEEVRFTLTPAMVSGIEVTRGFTAWIRVPWVRIDWCDASGTPGSFCLRPADTARLSLARAGAQRLFAMLAHWRASAEPAASATVPDEAPALPPRADAVTGELLARVVSPRAFGPVIPWLLVATAVACAVFGLPFDPFRGPGWLEAAGAALIAMVAFQLPYWLVREPRPDAGSQPA